MLALARSAAAHHRRAERGVGGAARGGTARRPVGVGRREAQRGARQAGELVMRDERRRRRRRGGEARRGGRGVDGCGQGLDLEADLDLDAGLDLEAALDLEADLEGRREAERDLEHGAEVVAQGVVRP